MLKEAPKTAEDLQALILEHYDSLSKRLKQVADFIANNPNDMALESLVVVAERCGTQPSTFVRFAKYFGFSGASEVQKLFRQKLYETDYVPSYEERIRRLKETAEEAGADTDDHVPANLLGDLADRSIIALEYLKDNSSNELLSQTIQLINEKKTVYLMGMRRSFPVTSYLNYALRRLHKNTHLLTGHGGMLMEEAAQITAEDLVIVVSFYPGAEESREVAIAAKKQGAAVVAITDNKLSGVAREADVLLEVNDADLGQFRSLTATMCLAQSLAMGYAYLKEGPEVDVL